VAVLVVLLCAAGKNGELPQTLLYTARQGGVGWFSLHFWPSVSHRGAKHNNQWLVLSVMGNSKRERGTPSPSSRPPSLRLNMILGLINPLCTCHPARHEYQPRQLLQKKPVDCYPAIPCPFSQPPIHSAYHPFRAISWPLPSTIPLWPESTPAAWSVAAENLLPLQAMPRRKHNMLQEIKSSPRIRWCW